MKTEKKLYKVDINVKYLVYTDVEYNKHDVTDWLKEDFHSGELDDACEISLVKDVSEIEEDFKMDYCPYYTNAGDEDVGASLDTIIDDLGLDAGKMIKRLKSLGYTVTKK